jgi:hypothetical protein
LLDVRGSALIVSQFTLYGDARGQQRRPSFVAAAPPEQAKNVYEEFAEALRRLGVTVATGVFGAMMGRFWLSALSHLTVSLVCLPHLKHVISSGKLSKNIVFFYNPPASGKRRNSKFLENYMPYEICEGWVPIRLSLLHP